ncbi:MAG: NUDIX domain-containing protein [Candidatus Pacearchaeota archaeon]
MLYANLAYVLVDGKILMMNKDVRDDDPNSGYHTLPGGKLEEDEMGGNPQGRLEAVVREVGQETGKVLLDPVLSGVILFDNSERIFPGGKKLDNYLVYVYRATRTTGRMFGKSKEGIPYLLDKSKLRNVPQNPGDKIMYGWIEDGRNFFGVIKHVGDKVDVNGTFVDYL